MISTQRSVMPPELLQELQEDFAAVDDDQDGRVDFAEFSSLMDNLEAGMSDTDLEVGFREIDADRDGRISLEEFVAWRAR